MKGALAPDVKARQRKARARVHRIREGMQNYIHTLGYIAEAWAEGDWKTLGYASWEEYLAKEFGANQVKLPPEQRLKALRELRLEDMPNRALAAAMNVDEKTTRRDRAAAANAAVIDGELVDSPARPALVEAMTGAIEDAEKRAEDHRESAPGEAEPVRGVATEPGAAAGAGACDPAPAPDPGVAAPVEEADAQPASSRAPSEQGGPATSPAGPSCEKCGTGIADDGYRRCASCDVDGLHTASDDGGCRLCKLLATVPDEYLPIQVAEGVHGLQLECRCGAVVSHLKAGMPLGIALVEAHLHHGTCQ